MLSCSHGCEKVLKPQVAIQFCELLIDHPLCRICRCGCNRSVSQSTAWRPEHCIETHPESPPPPSGIAPLIFRWARSLSSSHPTSRSGLAQTTYPLTLPCHCSIHHQHRIYFNRQKMHLLKRLVSSSTIFFWIFILGHIKLLIKVMTRIL